MLLTAAALSLVNARVWDGTGAPPYGPVTVHLAGGRVVAIDSAPPAEGDTILDAGGATVIPGLIDSHVHLSLDPGAGWRQDTPAEHEVLLRAHMRALLACGVTTVLDPAVLPAEEALIRSIEVGPRYLSLGVPFSPPGGYVAVVVPGFPSVATVADVDRQLDSSAGQVGVKVTVERGFYGPIWPLHRPEILAAIRDGARARGLPIYAHAMSVAEQRLAVDVLGAAVTVHALEVPNRAMIEHIVEAGVYEMTTLSPSAAFDTGALDDPWLDRFVPAVELATARDPEVRRRFQEKTLEVMAPGLPFRRLIAHGALPAGQARAHVRRAGRALRAMADAGVPLVMGSDSGNWPMIPSLFHGTSTLRELELLTSAGLTPEEVLTASTRTPGRMLGMDLGVLRPGAPADLVVVEGDPLRDIRAMRSIRWTVHDGVVGTPAEWMAR